MENLQGWLVKLRGEATPSNAISLSLPPSGHAASAATTTLLEMEGRAVTVSNNYLSLVGILSVFALNEPLWASSFQLTQFQTGVQHCSVSEGVCIAPPIPHPHPHPTSLLLQLPPMSRSAPLPLSPV